MYYEVGSIYHLTSKVDDTQVQIGIIAHDPTNSIYTAVKKIYDPGLERAVGEWELIIFRVHDASACVIEELDLKSFEETADENTEFSDSEIVDALLKSVVEHPPQSEDEC